MDVLKASRHVHSPRPFATASEPPQRRSQVENPPRKIPEVVDKWIDWVSRWVTERSKIVALILLLILAFASFGYLFERDTWRSFLSERGEEGRPREEVLLEDVKDDFQLSRFEAYLIVQGDDLLAAENVRAIRSIVAELESLEQIDDVIWIDDIPILNVFGLADPLLPPDDASDASFAQVRERVLDHPLVRGQLLSADARTMMLPMRIEWLFVDSDEDVNAALLATAERAIEDRPVELKLGLTGDVPLYQAQIGAYRRNQRKFQLLGYALVFGLSAFLFRGVIPILIVGLATILAIFVTFGLLRWLQFPANPLTDAVLPVLIALLGVTDGVHMMVHLRLRRAAGDSPIEAVRAALREVGSACVLTSLTTAVGFGSLLLAQSEFVQQFGRACAVGVLLTLGSVLTVIPLLSLSRLGRNLHQGVGNDVVVSNIGRMRGMINLVTRRYRTFGIAGIAVTLFFAGVGLWMRPDSHLKSALPNASPEAQSLAIADSELGGIELARIVVEWPDEVPWDSPEILKAVEDAQRLVDDEPTLSNSISITNVLATLPGEETGDEQRMRMIDLMPVQLRDNFYQRDSQRVLISFRAQDLGVGRYQKVFQELDQELDRLEQKHDGFRYQLTGDVVIRGRKIYQIVEDLARSLGAATVIIFVMLAIAFRSLRLGLIAVVPNLFPLASTAFLIVILDRPLNVSTVCAFTVCLGMAVDDTIHFLNRYVRLRNKGMPKLEAVREGFLQVGAALVMTTLVLLVGFATVLTSELPSQRTFAGMACCTIAAALFGDMVFLPALLRWFDRDDQRTDGDAGNGQSGSNRPCVEAATSGNVEAS